MSAEIRTGAYAQLGNGIRLHYASCGVPGRPLLLCLHGFPEYWAAWEGVLPAFGERYYAVAPDLRGFNLSSQPTDVKAYRAREIVGDLVQFVRVLGYERAFVAAHDWGGAVAWQLAISHREVVTRLVMLNSPHPIPFARELAGNVAQRSASEYMNWLRAPGSEAALAKDNFALMERLLRHMESPDSRWFTPELAARYREAWAHGLTGGVNYYRASPLYPPTAGDPGAAALTLDPEDFMVRVPVLVLWGMRDVALLPALLEGLDAVVPELTIERLDRATHWLIHEEPQFVAKRVLAFFDAAQV